MTGRELELGELTAGDEDELIDAGEPDDDLELERRPPRRRRTVTVRP